MSTDAEDFLRIEESAQNVLKALSALKEEADSYKASTEALNAVRDQLVSMIKATQDISVDSHDVVKQLKRIGGPEILHSIGRLRILAAVGIAASSLSLIGVILLLVLQLVR